MANKKSSRTLAIGVCNGKKYMHTQENDKNHSRYFMHIISLEKQQQKVEEKENRLVIETERKFRPLAEKGVSKAEMNNRQKLINKSIKEDTDLNSLGFEVEEYEEETKKVKSIPIVRTVNKVTEKTLKKVEVFVKLNQNQARIAAKNITDAIS